MVLTAESDLGLNVPYVRKEYGGVFVLCLMTYLNPMMMEEVDMYKLVNLLHSILTSEISFLPVLDRPWIKNA